MRIPIVMVSDKNYVLQTRVAIWTMRKNSDDKVFLDITIFCSPQLDKKSRYRLKELETILTNLKINFHEVDPQIFINAKVSAHVPVASFYRLLIPEIFKQDEKCLFLDGDIIVNVDLQELYLENVEDVYIAGVRDEGFLCDPDEALKHYKMYGFRSCNTYVNAGVLIFNITKLREQHLHLEFLKCLKTYYPYMDQDILNKVCDGQVKLLASEFNYFNRGKNIKVLENRCEIEKNWKILHFAGEYKPWNNLRIRYAKEWWAWAQEALEENEYNKLYFQVKELTEKNDWSYILNRCIREKKIIIVGYSRIGVDVFVSLKKCNVMAEIFFCDNSKEKRDLSNIEITIHTVEELKRKYPQALWIITSQRSSEIINSQLIELGITEEKIITYINKEGIYYDMLDDAYIEYELNQMRLKNVGNTDKIGEYR